MYTGGVKWGVRGAAALWVALALQAQDPLIAGREALERGDYPRAELFYREYLKQHPNSAEGLSNLAVVLARREKFDEAVATYRKALSADPKLTQIYFNLAVAYLRSEQYGNAVSALDQFLKSYPADNRARELLGICLVETGDLRRGIGELEKVLAADPHDVSAIFALAGAHIRAGDQARGQQLFEELEKGNAPPAQVHLLQGLVYYRAREYERAEKEIRSVLEYDPQSGPALAALGRLRLLRADEASAIEYFEKALKVAPQDAESNYYLGVLFDRKGQVAQGREHLNRAIALRPSYPEAMYTLGRIEFRSSNFKAALPLLERATKYAPNEDVIHLLLARTYQALGQQEKAKLEFAEVRRIQSSRINKAVTEFQGEEPALRLEPAPQEAAPNQ